MRAIICSDISNLTNDYINNITQFEITKLDDKIILLPEVNNIILNKLYELDKAEALIKIKAGNYKNIITLLKTHYNKEIIRELIKDNAIDIINRCGDIYIKSFINELLHYNEIGLAQIICYNLKITNSNWNNLSYLIINNSYYEFTDNNIKFEKMFKIMSSSDLFIYFMGKEVYRYDLYDKIKILYIRFLKIAIKFNKIEFIKLMLEYFDNNRKLENLKCFKDLTIINLLKQLEALVIKAKNLV